MSERRQFDALVTNFDGCVLGLSDVGWSTEVEAESEEEAFQLALAEAVSVSEAEGLPPHGIRWPKETIRAHLSVFPRRVDRPRVRGKYFRIMVAPRGLPGFLVGEYLTLDFQSYVRMIRNADRKAIFATLADARNALPPAAKHLPSKREYQFIELWEAG